MIKPGKDVYGYLLCEGWKVEWRWAGREGAAEFKCWTRRAWARKRVLGVLLSNHLKWPRKNVTPCPELFTTPSTTPLRAIASREHHPDSVVPPHSCRCSVSLGHHGGRAHEIPPSQPIVFASRRAPPKSRHIAVQARIDNNNMAQGEGGAAASRETGDAGQEEYRRNAAEGTPDILRKAPASTPVNCMLTPTGTQ